MWPTGPNCAEAESNASLLAIASGATAYVAHRAKLRRSREQCKCIFAPPQAQLGDIPRHGPGPYVILTYKAHLNQ